MLIKYYSKRNVDTNDRSLRNIDINVVYGFVKKITYFAYFSDNVLNVFLISFEWKKIQDLFYTKTLWL